MKRNCIQLQAGKNRRGFFIVFRLLFVTALLIPGITVKSEVGPQDKFLDEEIDAPSSYGESDPTYGESYSSSPAEPPLKRYAKWQWIDAELRTVFKNFSDVGNIDIVLSDNVKGTITLTLTDKTWKDAFQIVCKVKRLASVVEDDYIFVMTREEYRANLLSDAAGDIEAQKVSALHREIIRLSNVPADEMQSSIADLLSERGKITVASHANALIVFDTEENIEQIKTMVQQLDIETEQISIAAKIIEVSSGTMQNLGIQWGIFGTVAGTPFSGTHVQDTPVAASALERLTYGILSQDKLSLTLEYLFQENEGEVVAQPSITTLDNQEARIFMGGLIPLIALDEAGNQMVTFQEAGTELTVTPHITDKNRITLDINAKKESFDAATRNIQSQEAMTNVVVNNGETVVIAGLTSNDESEREEGIPVLKDIPLIGNLFKRTITSYIKRDLIIFVTPNIIQKDLEAIGG